ncbi:MAG: uncharacterized protein JWR69_3969 [Pedosphaera sp.]|nr:uncharacterized protein [Pedosphaera sp.]
MSYIEQMFETHPRKLAQDDALWIESITATWSCAESCAGCADACVGEDHVETLRRCIRMCQDCADVCEATAKLLTRQTESDSNLIEGQLQACIVACQVCGAECERHSSELAHCEVCSIACHRCEKACQELSSRL